MVERVTDTDAMIAGMSPKLADGAFVFCTAPNGSDTGPLLSAAIATMHEAEGLSMILPLEAAQAAGCDVSLPMAQITLQVHSALDGVGLTAAVATALADQGIACNMVAGYHHDHAFVPRDQAQAAVAILAARAAQA